MTYPDAFAGLDPSPQDLEDLAEVMAEIDGEQAAVEAGAYSWPEDDGLDGATGLSSYGYGAIELAGDFGELDAIMDRAAGHQQQVIAEDVEDQLARRPRFEDKIARAVDRLSRGTYLPQGMYAQGRDPSGQFAPVGCGRLDTYGRCSSRYHDGGCMEPVRSSAATGDGYTVERWNETLRRGTPAAVAMAFARSAAEDYGEDGEVIGPGNVTDWNTYIAMRQAIGF
jgi:hypothetical protein